MNVRPIDDLLSGERVLAVHPPLALQVDAGFRRRLHLFTGRTLSDTALHVEQDGRAGRLALLGQALSPGVVNGLEVELEDRGDNPLTAGHVFLHVAPGFGLTHEGEDVVLGRALRVDLSKVRVPPGSAGTAPGAESPTIPASTRVTLLVLQPTMVRLDDESEGESPCDRDPTREALRDLQRVDAVQLLCVPWHADWGALPNGEQAFRNRLAHTIFELERVQGPDELHPWERFGVPLGVLGLPANGRPWLDRYSVVRRGGGEKRRQPLVAAQPVLRAGSPYLLQARIQQFAEQLTELVAPNGLKAAHLTEFAALPPVGMLPREALELATPGSVKQHFFPENWRVKVAPLPLEQLDDVVRRSASLAPLLRDDPEDVLVLAPVPQAVFEPQLLLLEGVDPIFGRAIERFVFERHGLRLRRALLRRDLGALIEASAGRAALAVYPQQDPEALEQDELPKLPEPLPELLPKPDELGPVPPPLDANEAPTSAWDKDERYGVAGAAELSVVAMRKLLESLEIKEYEDENPDYDPVNPGETPPTVRVRRGQVFSKREIEELESGMGLDAFIAKIDDKLARADDTIDFSFLKGHANIYRLRQFMLGNIAATRLASSPILNTIAKGASAAAVTDEVNKFYFSVKGKAPPGTVVPPGTAAPPRTAEAPPSPAPAPSPALELRLERPIAGLPRERLTGASLVGASALFRAVALPRADLGLAATPSFRVPIEAALPQLRAEGFERARLEPVSRPTLELPIFVRDELRINPRFDDIFVRPKPALPLAPPPRETVRKDQPIVGEGDYDFRTVSIAQRIEASPGRDAKNYAVAARVEAVEALRLLADAEMNIDDIPIFGVPERDAQTGAPLFHRAFLDAAGAERDSREGQGVVDNPRAGMVRRLPRPVSMRRVLKSPSFGGLGRLLRDPAGKDADEGNLYSDAALIVEHAIATLRAVESRIAEYRAELDKCKRALAIIEADRSAASARLAAVDAELAESRHKVATARALLREETARVQRINQRRASVMNEHVRFFVFVRPRFAEALLDAPLHPLDPGLIEPAVPACLAAHEELPAAIDDLVQLLREAPLAWFAQAPTLLGKLDRVELLHGTLAISKMRAQATSTLERQPATFHQRTLAGKFGQAIQAATLSQQRTLSAYRLEVAQLDLVRFAGLSWKETHERASPLLSLGDLIEANHGRSQVADLATRELAQIARIAGCLHAQLSDVLPAIRLTWAERLSQYAEENISLHNLGVLPRWVEVPDIDRREIEQLVDWLYGRIDARQRAGISWMDDLVRVCILLASHAPVDAIVAGAVVEDTPAAPGRAVPVTIDPAQVRMGMKVLFYQNQALVAHGVVEDLMGGHARTRLAEVANELVLSKGTAVRFVDAFARTSPLTTRGG